MSDYASQSNRLVMRVPHRCYPKGATPLHQQRWFPFAATVQGELDRVSQMLTGRIRQLVERDATPLPQLTIQVATFSARMDKHLKKIGMVPLRRFLTQHEVSTAFERGWSRRARLGLAFSVPLDWLFEPSMLRPRAATPR